MKNDDTVLSLKNDYLFKAVFGMDNENSKFILKAFLNKILDREDDPIVDLEYDNPFQLKEYSDDKGTILDVRATTSKEEMFDIEMQIVWHKYMPCRLIFYHGGQIRDSLKEGEDYDKMRPTITICITDSIVFDSIDQYMTQFYFMEEKSHIKFCNRTKICCIELPKVNRERRALEEMSQLEIYLEYLRCENTTDSEYVKELVRRGGKELEMAHRAFEQATQDKEIRNRAIDRDKYIRDQISLKAYREETDKLRAETEVIRAETVEMRAQVEIERAEAVEMRAQVEIERAEAVELRAQVEIERAETEKMRTETEEMRAEAAEMQRRAVKSMYQAGIAPA